LTITFAHFVPRNPLRARPARCFQVTLNAKRNAFGATLECPSFCPLLRNYEPFPKALVYRLIDNLPKAFAAGIPRKTSH
jgi:hypothetical protein